MNTAQRLAAAWQAVKDSGVPEHLHAVAFQEAFAAQPGGPAASAAKVSKTTKDKGAGDAAPVTDANTFFAKLASESGVDEADLQEALHYDSGVVKVAPPARKLGTTTKLQAQTVTALVAGARYAGLGESPVPARHVREACEAKNCYDSGNFSKHVGALRGFNLSGKRDSAEVLINAKWLREFKAAIDLVTEKSKDAS